MKIEPGINCVRGIYGSLGIPRLTRTIDTRLSFRQVVKECLEPRLLLDLDCSATPASPQRIFGDWGRENKVQSPLSTAKEVEK